MSKVPPTILTGYVSLAPPTISWNCHLPVIVHPTNNSHSIHLPLPLNYIEFYTSYTALELAQSIQGTAEVFVI